MCPLRDAGRRTPYEQSMDGRCVVAVVIWIVVFLTMQSGDAGADLDCSVFAMM
jgi:hypothetical protein